MRKIYCIPSTMFRKEIDVLIIDEVGSEWLRYCVPDNLQCTTLKIRGVIPVAFTPLFAVKLVKRILTLGVSPLAYMAALIDVLKPKVVISFTDSRMYGLLDKIFTDVAVIVVQNGVRTTHPTSLGNWSQGDILPTHFGFGKFEQELMNNLGIHINDYYPAGSLKLGLYLSQSSASKNNTKSNHRNICFVSQFRAGMCNSSNQETRKHVIYCQKTYELLVNWATKREYTISVALSNEQTNEDFNAEITFYDEIIKSDVTEYVPNRRLELTSYFIGEGSSAVLTMDSALGYELFGAGVKVLFSGSADFEFQKKWGVVGAFEKLPKQVCLSSYEQGEFDQKLDALLNLKQDEYLAFTKEARAYYMNCTDVYPHEAIKKHIEEHYRAFHPPKS